MPTLRDVQQRIVGVKDQATRRAMEALFETVFGDSTADGLSPNGSNDNRVALTNHARTALVDSATGRIARFIDEDSFPKSALSDTDFSTIPFEMARINSSWEALSIPTPYSPGHVVEPSTQYFDHFWRGYKYWMAYVPFANSNDQTENPCVAASNDGRNWTARGIQPLVQPPAGGYNSDPALGYDPIGDQLILVWREAIGSTCNLKLMLSSDGETWTAPVTIYTATNAVLISGGKDFAAPSVWYNASTQKYEVIGHNLQTNADAWPLVKITSSNLTSGWDANFTVLNLPAPAAGRKFWHSQFRLTGSGAIFGIAQDTASVSGNGSLYLVRSDNGTDFYSALLDNSKGWYQPSFVMLKDRYNKCWLEIIASQLPNGANYGLWRAIATLDIGGSAVKVAGNNAASATAMRDLDETLSLGALLSAARGGHAGILIADDFNRADSAVGVGNSIDGKTWTQTGAGADVIGISGNRAYNATNNNCRIIYDTGVSDYIVRATIATKSTGEWYIVVRHQDTSNFIRIGCSGTSNQLKWEVILAGAVDGTVSGTLGATPSDGDEVKVICRGDFILIFLRGSLVGIKRQTSLKTKTIVGLQMATGAGQYVDNFVAARLL